MIARVLRGAFFLLIAAGFVLLFYTLAPREDPSGRGGAVTVGRGDAADAHLEGLRYLEWKGGDLAWVMEAREARFFYLQERSDFEDVRVTFLASAGERFLLSAARVGYSNQSRTLTAAGRVRLESGQGYHLVADTVTYDARDKGLSTQDKVSLKKDRLLIEGKGMEGSLVDRRFRLLSGVKAAFTPE